MGASLCMILASWGSAWGTWRAGLGICHMGIDHPVGIIKTIVPIVMAGVLGIYGLIVSVIITQAVVPPADGGTNLYSTYNGYTHVRIYYYYIHDTLLHPYILNSTTTHTPQSSLSMCGSNNGYFWSWGCFCF